MADSRFLLKEPKSTEETLVYLFYQTKGVKVKISTGVKINPKYWNFDSQRVKKIREVENHEQINALFKTLDSIIAKRELDLVNEGRKLTIQNLRQPVVYFLNRDENESTVTFKTFIKSFIETSNKKPNTIKQYNTSNNRLIAYENHTRKNVNFDDVDLDFYNDFTKFMIEKDYSLNSIGTSVKNIKVYMNEAVERGLTKNLEFRNKKFKIVEEETENIYLSEEEIKRIYELDLSTNKRLDRVRDLFIIACFTGLRFSDLIQLRDENFIDSKTKIRIKTEKTGDLVVIPLNSYIKNILEKNGGMIPDLISNVKMNKYLKELAEKAEIKEDVIISFTKGGVRKSVVYKKFDLVTVHTARRSFATNAFLRDIPTISVMKITGHRTERSFMKYIKISQEDNANKLTDHPFFN